jgi:GGDEF domain-containing protein
VVVFSDVTRDREDERSLAFLAHHDPLTGLPNRAPVPARGRGSPRARAPPPARVALLYIDLDEFKECERHARPRRR